MRVTPENLGEVLEHLRQTKILSIDCETTGLSETDRPFSFIIADESKEYYFDERVLPWYNQEQIEVLFKDPGKMWLGQNLKFDMRMMLSAGYEFAGDVCDIAVLARLVRNDHMKYNLDAQAKRFGWAKGQDKIKECIKEHDLYEIRKDFFGVAEKHPRYDLVPIDIMEEYACLDARLTYDLYVKYMELLPEASHALWRNECELTKVCFKMERHGLLLDKDYTMKAMYHEIEKSEEARNRYEAITGERFVNSAKSFQSWLGDRYQLPTTDAGNPSLTDDVLEEVIGDLQGDIKEAAELIQVIRHYSKRVSTYYQGYLNAMDKNSVVHPTMWQGGTKTGRFSYSDPNLQNIPKEEKSVAPYVVRGCFVPRPGTVFVSFDYSQMEYRLLAAYANEVGIIDRVMAGEDFHAVAASLFGVERTPAKTLNFACLYGAGDEKLARMLGIPVRESKFLKLKYFMALSRVEKLVQRIKSTGKARGYVTNWMGRNLYSDYNHVYALPNHLIQGSGADVVKVAMVRIAKEFPDIPMVLQVHDQLVFEVKPEQYKCLPRIKEIMETSFPAMNGMTLSVDVEWSSKSLAVRDMTKGMVL